MKRRILLAAAAVALLAAGYYFISPAPPPEAAPVVTTAPSPPEEKVTLRTNDDPQEVFQRAFWRRPTAEDRILHAERRERARDLRLAAADAARQADDEGRAHPGR